MTRVSVVIPTLNRARLLAEAIGSVLAQDYSAKEIVVVDDGSTDDTAAVVARLAQSTPVPITFVQLEHQWIVRARNAGIRAARGGYIAFLDSDDRLLPGSLTARAAYLDQHANVGLVCSDAEVINAAGEVVGLKSVLTGKPRYRNNFRWETVEYYATTSTVMARRECLEAVGLFDERITRSAEDWHLWVRLAGRYDLAYLDQPLAAYRVHAGNDSRAHDEINRANRLAAALVVEAPEFASYPPSFRAKLLFYRFATAWRVEPKPVALRYFARAVAADPRQWRYGARVIRQGLRHLWQRWRGRRTI
jgi:glycosyltransferase involved in cell wall biosynthesis